MGRAATIKVMDPSAVAVTMRAPLLSLLLVLPALAGCIAAQTDDLTPAAAQLAGVEVPAGAKLVEDARGTLLRFADVKLPFEKTVTIPEGATVVRATGTLVDDLRVSAYMYNEDTGRRRCNTDVVDAWNLPVVGSSTCSGLAAIDPPGAKWTVRVSGPAAAVATVDVLFETLPLDGIAAQLDLSQLSMPTLDLVETQYLEVPSFDGTPLWVEVTLPEGEGPWPTVIAASPYNGQMGRGETPAMWTYFTQDWAKRGYAVVNVDVRGFGMSGGCVEIWSENEQKDQAFIVDWVADQTWSDGKVGFYGQSYVGTTPVAAAVQAPEALKAIIAVAPVINAYYDWHFGGVPNGENALSPVAYQVLTDMPGGHEVTPTNPIGMAEMNAKGVCDPTIMPMANDPRAVYDAFYEERNFSARVDNVKAAVLYTQGFEDSNVKSAMIPWWFNEIQAPKLGLFGHWVHQHPTRADEEILFLGWMDQYVKGRALGFENIAPVEVVVADHLFRSGESWPPTDAVDKALATDFGKGRLGEAGSGAQMMLAPAPLNGGWTLDLKLEEPLAVAGIPRVAVTGTLAPGGNGYLYAELWDIGDDDALVSYGMFNIAHRGGHDSYQPATAGEKLTFELPFLPTEWVFPEGNTLRLVLKGSADRAFDPGQPALFTFEGGEATRLVLPTLDIGAYSVTPGSALR